MLGSLTVDCVQLEGWKSASDTCKRQGDAYATGLELAVNEGTGEASEDLLGLGVAGGLAVLLAVFFVCLCSLYITQ
jgi:hypothetical protein